MTANIFINIVLCMQDNPSLGLQLLDCLNINYITYIVRDDISYLISTFWFYITSSTWACISNIELLHSVIVTTHKNIDMLYKNIKGKAKLEIPVNVCLLVLYMQLKV